MNFKLQGVVVPIMTPFDAAGEFDPTATKRLVNYLIKRGVHGLFPCGTTGEGFLLSLDERRRVAETVIDAASGRIPVIIHSGAANTADTLALTTHANAAGADAVAVIPPFVYHHCDAALMKHYLTVANSVPDLPVLLYNFPAISNNTFTFDLVMALREEAPNIIGMKDSSGSLELLTQLLAATDGEFLTFNGGDGQVLASAVMGLSGCVSGNANVMPELLVELHDLATNGALERARRLQKQVNVVRDLLGDGGNLSLFKQMVARRGIKVGDVRAPLLTADPELAAACWRQLSTMGIDVSYVG